MKKLIIISIAIFMGFMISIQGEEIKYQGEVLLGSSIVISDTQQGRPVINFRTIHGARIGQYLFTGMGIGADWYLFDFGSDGDDSEAVVPVFVNVKGYYPVSKEFSPLISLDLGYGFGVSQGIKGKNGFLFSPAIGIQYKKFQAQIGYESNLSIKTCQLKVGLIF